MRCNEYVFNKLYPETVTTGSVFDRIMNTYAKRLNSKDIARKAGVSQTTVSRVLSGHPNVREATKLRVLKVIEDAGYQPNAFARAMKTQMSGVIGVVVSRITNPVVPEILLGLGTELTARGRQMVVWNTDAEGEDGVIRAIRQRAVDGLIFTAATDDSKALDVALQSTLGVVLLNRTVADADCDQVAGDNRNGARLLAQYLVDSGRRRFALVNGPLNRSTLREREEGLRSGLADAGMAIDESRYVSAPFSHDVFRQAAIELMALPEPPDVICCGNDVIGLGVLCGLKAAGHDVPDDVWVAGFDGIEMAGWDVFDMTTVRQPLEMMVFSAVDNLVETIEGRRPAHSIRRFETELVVRSTTANAPFSTKTTGASRKGGKHDNAHDT